jgi:Sec-independent protein translocase protein TatA
VARARWMSPLLLLIIFVIVLGAERMSAALRERLA